MQENPTKWQLLLIAFVAWLLFTFLLLWFIPMSKEQQQQFINSRIHR